MTQLVSEFAGTSTDVFPAYEAEWRLLEPIDVGHPYNLDLRLGNHPDLAKILRICLVLERSIALFSPGRHPCFSHEFIHSGDLPDEPAGLSLFGL